MYWTASFIWNFRCVVLLNTSYIWRLCSTLCAVRCIQSSSLLLLHACFPPLLSGTSAVWYLCYLAPLLFGGGDDELSGHLCCLVPLLFGTSVIWRRWRWTLLDCVGSAKHHKFKCVQHNDTGDKEVDSFLPLFIDFTELTTAVFEDIIADVHYMNCQTEYQLHQLLKTTKNLFPSETLQALTDTATGAVAVGDGFMSVACKKQPLKIGKY